MNKKTSRPLGPERTRRRWPLFAGLGAIIIVLAVLGLLRLRATPAEAVASAPVKGSYRNRSLFQPPAGAGATDPAQRSALSGTVYEQGGDVIAGAKVVASTFDVAGNVTTIVGSARTDELGAFYIEVPDGIYQVHATMDGYGPTSAAIRAGEPTSLVLPTSGVVKGRVLDEKGKPLERFSIDVISVVPPDMPAPPALSSRRFESPDGTYRLTQLPAWPVILRATAPDKAPAYSQPLAQKPEEERIVDLTLTEGCTLTGRVEDKQGKALPEVFVDAEARIAAGTVGDFSAQTPSQVASGADGTFSLTHVPKGVVVVRGYDGDNATSTVTVEINDCAHPSPVKLTLSKGGSLTGVAKKADGTLLAGAHLTLMNRSVGFVNAVTDDQGRFRFDQVPSSESLRLELEHAGQRALQFVHVRDGETTTQDMTLFGTGPGEIRGKVTAGDKPLAGVRLMVAAFHNRKTGIDMYFPVTGPDGTYRLRSIPVGNYVVNAVSTQSAGSAAVAAEGVSTVDLDISTQNSLPDRGPHAPSDRAAAKQAAKQPAQPAPEE